MTPSPYSLLAEAKFCFLLHWKDWSNQKFFHKLLLLHPSTTRICPLTHCPYHMVPWSYLKSNSPFVCAQNPFIYLLQQSFLLLYIINFCLCTGPFDWHTLMLTTFSLEPTSLLSYCPYLCFWLQQNYSKKLALPSEAFHPPLHWTCSYQDQRWPLRGHLNLSVADSSGKMYTDHWPLT